jgi:hypothetical protein
MDRDQAIEGAKNLRKHMTVAKFTPADKDNDTPAFWSHEEFKSISAAKRRMRELGRGVALRENEKLPTPKA